MLASLPVKTRKKVIASLSDEEALRLVWDWHAWARPNQIAPEGDWTTWLLLAGRGFGKTRSGSEWVRSIVCGKTPLAAGAYSRIALVAETAADARDVLVEGESAILSVHPKDFRPLYEPSKRRLTWPNGAVATLFNATEPDQLRGPQFDAAWCDELAKWKYAKETWDMLQFGLRLGHRPKQVVTTTPRPIPVLKEILADPGTVVTKGKTEDNRSNLAASFLNQIRAKYTGTRLGRQELDAEILDDAPGALWTRSAIDRDRRKESDVPRLTRIVVAVDPAAKTNVVAEDGAATGIVVAGMGDDGRGYVLDDLTCRTSPDGWARRALSGMDRYGADCIVVETNNGGEMVAAAIKAVRPTAPIREVTASRGKWTRAEPIAALYEQGRISHVGSLPDLEDEMVLFGPNGMVGGSSPDHVDALVWALTELFPMMIRHAKQEQTGHVAKPAVNLGHSSMKRRKA